MTPGTRLTLKAAIGWNRSRRALALLYCAAVLLCWREAAAQSHQHHGARAPCPDSSLSCAIAATPTFAPDGSLLLAWSAGGRVMIARSADLAASFGAAVPVTPDPVRIDTGPDSRPKIVVTRTGDIVVAYSVFRDDQWNGQVRVARSTDSGASFAPSRPITDDAASQRFEALALDPSGDVFAAWIDKRSVAAARTQGKDYPGAALAFARSQDAGESFSVARIAQENTCECCRLGVAFAGPGRPAVAFRNIFDGKVRDHAITTFADPGSPGPVYRVSVDDWAIDGCPHHGPSLAIAADESYHVTWFTEGSVRQGTFYARSSDGGRSFSAPMPLGHPDRQPGRAQVLAVGREIWLAWQEFDGEQTTIWSRMSRDVGATWSEPQAIAQTLDAADHPMLVSGGKRAFLSWLTRAEGYRLLPLEGAL
jgi:hypothetical protein